MSYTKQTFVNNQTVLTAEMMNHIEAGIVENENKISQLSEEKVNANQGVENAGKILGIGADGKVTPVDVQSDTPVENVLLYTEQTLTDAQKTQARANIGIYDENTTPIINDAIDLRVDGGVTPRDVYDPNTNTIDDAIYDAFLKSDGEYTTHVNYFTTGKIYIEPETTYTIHGDGIVYEALAEKSRARAFSKNDVALTPLTWGMDEDGNYTITTPPEADYIRISVAKNQIGYSSSTYMEDLLAKFNDIFALTTLKTTFDANEFLNDKSICSKHLADDTKPLYGKTIVNFGDSIFGNYVDKGTDISTWLNRNSGATVINCAFGGCRMGAHEYTGWDVWSMYRLVDGIVSGDWTLQENSLTTYPEQAPDYVNTTFSNLKNVNWDKVNVVTISYGTNDWSSGVALDNPDNDEDTSTFLGALRYSVRKLLNAHPKLSVVLITPFWRCKLSDGVITDDSDGAFVNNLEKTVAEYASAEIETAKALHIPIWDSYHTAGFNRMTWETYFDVNDGTHFNIYGRQRIAKLLQKQIELYASV